MATATELITAESERLHELALEYKRGISRLEDELKESNLLLNGLEKQCEILDRQLKRINR
jgi:hypothetical protein